MSRFIQILIAILAITCYFECGAETTSLVKQLDEHVQSKTQDEQPLEAISEGLNFMNSLSEGQQKSSAELDLLNYLREIQDILKGRNDCGINHFNNFFRINANLYELVEKGGKLHIAIGSYVKKMYDACSTRFRKAISFADSKADKLDNFIRFVANRVPKICDGISKDNKLWNYECASKLDSLSSREISELVMDYIKTKKNRAELAQATSSSLQKNVVRQSLANYLNSIIAGNCHIWYLKDFNYKSGSKMLDISDIIDYWTRFAKIAGIQQVDELLKARGRNSVCNSVGSLNIWNGLVEVAHGKI